MSEDVVVSIFDENNNIEEENLLLGKVSAFWWKGALPVRLEPIFPLPNNEQIEILCLVAHVSFEYDFSSCSECRFTHRLWYLCLELPRLQKQGNLIFSYILSYTYSYTRTYIMSRGFCCSKVSFLQNLNFRLPIYH